MAQPDERNGNRPNVLVVPVATTTTTPTTSTTTASTTVEATPNCEDLAPGAICPQLDCAFINSDILTVDGVECYSCPRCVVDINKY